MCILIPCTALGSIVITETVLHDLEHFSICTNFESQSVSKLTRTRISPLLKSVNSTLFFIDHEDHEGCASDYTANSQLTV